VRRNRAQKKGRKNDFPRRARLQKISGHKPAAVYKPAWRGLPRSFKSKPLVRMENN
jgi:hypothetical protein